MHLRMAAAPNALLHVGQARLALVTWLTARRHGGRVTLRLDDPDAAALREDHRETVQHDLQWLGLDWDACVLQSSRLEAYAAAAERLRASRRLYPCFESEDELRFKRELRQRQGKPTIYDRAMLKMTSAQRAKAEAGGKRPYWRFLLGGVAAEWGDMVLGRQQVKLSAISDPVVIRADGMPLGLFTGVVDDLELGVTHVLRDADQVTVSGMQLDMRAALGGRAGSFRYGHLPEIVMDGAGRRGLPSIRSLRADGLEPGALAGVLAALGTDGAAVPRTPGEMAQAWDLTRIGPGAARFEPGALLAVNRTALAGTAFEAVQAHLPAGATPAFWMAVRGGIDLLREARAWWEVVAGTIVPPLLADAGGVLRAATGLLPGEPWNGGVWRAWVAAVAEAAGRARAEVEPLLRLALTGEEDGPAMEGLLPLMGRTRASMRLQQASGHAGG